MKPNKRQLLRAFMVVSSLLSACPYSGRNELRLGTPALRTRRDRRLSGNRNLPVVAFGSHSYGIRSADQSRDLEATEPELAVLARLVHLNWQRNHAICHSNAHPNWVLLIDHNGMRLAPQQDTALVQLDGENRNSA